MGQRGPKPTPTALLKLRGSWRADTRQGEPRPEVGLPPPPSWLTKSALRHWPEIGDYLCGLGVMAAAHGPALAMLCENLALYIRLAKSKKHAFSDAKFKAWDRVMKSLREFGLTPSSITSIRVIQPNQTPAEADRPRLRLAK